MDYELVPSTTRIKSKAWPRLLSWTWYFKTNAEAYALNTLVALKEEDSFNDVIFHLRPEVGQEDLHSWEQPLHRNLCGWKSCKVSTEPEPVIFKRFRFRPQPSGSTGSGTDSVSLVWKTRKCQGIWQLLGKCQKIGKIRRKYLVRKKRLLLTSSFGAYQNLQGWCGTQNPCWPFKGFFCLLCH